MSLAATGGPGPRGRCWLCTSPVIALLRNSSPFSQHTFLGIHSCPQLLPDCLQLTGTRGGPDPAGSWRFLKRDTFWAWTLPCHPETRGGGAEAQQEQRSSANPQVLPRRGEAGRSGRFMAGVPPGNKSSSSSSCRAPFLLTQCSVSSGGSSWSTQPALISASTSPELLCRTPGGTQGSCRGGSAVRGEQLTPFAWLRRKAEEEPAPGRCCGTEKGISEPFWGRKTATGLRQKAPFFKVMVWIEASEEKSREVLEEPSNFGRQRRERRSPSCRNPAPAAPLPAREPSPAKILAG